jgi:hypothetical protein
MKKKSIYFITVIVFCIVITALATYFYNSQNASTVKPAAGPILDWVCKSTVDNAKRPLEQQIKKLQGKSRLQKKLVNYLRQRLFYNHFREKIKY